jgi:hypothetical protein
MHLAFLGVLTVGVHPPVTCHAHRITNNYHLGVPWGATANESLCAPPGEKMCAPTRF